MISWKYWSVMQRNCSGSAWKFSKSIMWLAMKSFDGLYLNLSNIPIVIYLGLAKCTYFHQHYIPTLPYQLLIRKWSTYIYIHIHFQEDDYLKAYQNKKFLIPTDTFSSKNNSFHVFFYIRKYLYIYVCIIKIW